MFLLVKETLLSFFTSNALFYIPKKIYIFDSLNLAFFKNYKHTICILLGNWDQREIDVDLLLHSNLAVREIKTLGLRLNLAYN